MEAPLYDKCHECMICRATVLDFISFVQVYLIICHVVVSMFGKYLHPDHLLCDAGIMCLSGSCLHQLEVGRKEPQKIYIMITYLLYVGFDLWITIKSIYPWRSDGHEGHPGPKSISSQDQDGLSPWRWACLRLLHCSSWRWFKLRIVLNDVNLRSSYKKNTKLAENFNCALAALFLCLPGVQLCFVHFAEKDLLSHSQQP